MKEKRSLSQEKEVVMLLAKSYLLETRSRKEAESLTRAGYDVTVISWDRFGQGPGDKRVAGVRNVSLSILSGMEFSKVAYALASVILMTYSFLWCIRHKKGTYFVHSNEFHTLLPGVMLRVLQPRRVRLVYDCRDLTPSGYAQWYGLGLGLVAGELEKKLLPYVDSIITVNSFIRDYLQQFTPAPIFIVRNTPDTGSIPSQSKRDLKEHFGLKGLVVSYVGMLRKDVALDEFIEAARQLSETRNGEISFVIVGYGPELNRIRAAASQLANMVLFVPRVPHGEALKYVKASDISFVVFRTLADSHHSSEYNRLVSMNSDIATPWKIHEAMACGSCVLVRKNTHTWKFAMDLGYGISAGSGTASEIADSLSWAIGNPCALDSMGDAAQKHFRESFSWDIASKNLLRAYQISV